MGRSATDALGMCLHVDDPTMTGRVTLVQFNSLWSATEEKADVAQIYTGAILY